MFNPETLVLLPTIVLPLAADTQLLIPNTVVLDILSPAALTPLPVKVPSVLITIPVVLFSTPTTKLLLLVTGTLFLGPITILLETVPVKLLLLPIMRESLISETVLD